MLKRPGRHRAKGAASTRRRGWGGAVSSPGWGLARTSRRRETVPSRTHYRLPTPLGALGPLSFPSLIRSIYFFFLLVLGSIITFLRKEWFSFSFPNTSPFLLWFQFYITEYLYVAVSKFLRISALLSLFSWLIFLWYLQLYCYYRWSVSQRLLSRPLIPSAKCYTFSDMMQGRQSHRNSRGRRENWILWDI